MRLIDFSCCLGHRCQLDIRAAELPRASNAHIGLAEWQRKEIALVKFR